MRLTLLPTAYSRADKAPGQREAAIFLDLAEQAIDRFRPEILLAYGGHPVCLELMHRARAHGVAVVFHLHNFAYNDRRGFADVSAIIFPSEYSRSHYRRRVGLDGVVIPDPIRLDKVIARNPEPKFVTFINPQPDKGAAVFARIALELGRRRPDIPLLVVEGRGKSDALAGLPVDLSGLTNLNRMANTPDPRDFYGVSRAVLMPSLWRESLGRVPIEAMANGVPVLAQRPGGCRKLSGTRASCSRSPSGARHRAGWCRLPKKSRPGWPSSSGCGTTPSFEAEHRRRALAEARRWDGERLAEQFERFFLSVCSGRG